MTPYHQAQLQVKEAPFILCDRRKDNRKGKRLTEMVVSTKNVLMHTFMNGTTTAKSGFEFNL